MAELLLIVLIIRNQIWKIKAEFIFAGLPGKLQPFSRNRFLCLTGRPMAEYNRICRQSWEIFHSPYLYSGGISNGLYDPGHMFPPDYF